MRFVLGLLTSLLLLALVSSRPSIRSIGKPDRKQAWHTSSRSQFALGQGKKSLALKLDSVSNVVGTGSGNSMEKGDMNKDPVSVIRADLQKVLHLASLATKAMVNKFSAHDGEIARIEHELVGQNLEQLVSSHTDLLSSFGFRIEDEFRKGLRELDMVKGVFNKINPFGGEDVHSQCNDAHQLVTDFNEDPSFISIFIQEHPDWLPGFGVAIRRDMNCIVKDIRGLDAHVSFVEELVGQEMLSFLAVNIGLKTLVDFGRIVDDEIERFQQAVKLVGVALELVELQDLKGTAADDQYARLMDVAKRLA